MGRMFENFTRPINLFLAACIFVLSGCVVMSGLTEEPDLNVPPFELRRDCSNTYQKQNLVREVGSAQIWTINGSDLDNLPRLYILEAESLACPIIIPDYSDTTNIPDDSDEELIDRVMAPPIYRMSYRTKPVPAGINIEGTRLEPFGTVDFMRAYSREYLERCRAENESLSTSRNCLADLEMVANESIEIYLSVKFLTGEAPFIVKLLNGKIYWKDEVIL